MRKKVKSTSIFFCSIVVGVIALIGFHFSDNIRGYFKFKHLCETEAGLKVYEKFESNAAWEVEHRRNAYLPASYEDRGHIGHAS